MQLGISCCGSSSVIRSETVPMNRISFHMNLAISFVMTLLRASGESPEEDRVKMKAGCTVDIALLVSGASITSFGWQTR